MGVYIELPKEWAKWSFDVRDIHDNILVANVTDLDLVRCGECKHWDETIEGHIDVNDRLCRRRLRWTMEVDFCSDGERRSEC